VKMKKKKQNRVESNGWRINITCENIRRGAQIEKVEWRDRLIADVCICITTFSFDGYGIDNT